ncbi:MAG: thioredoxin family protein [Polyangiaceae bacterium]
MRALSFALSLALATTLAACDNGGSGSAPSAAETFAERSEAEVNAAIDAAKERARRENKQVLLEFVAPWCADCREVSKVSRQEPAASVLREKYVVVPVNVGRFDKHKALLQEHGVKVIAALVVLDADGKRVAKTTLEPISRKEALTPDELAAWLRAPSGS